MLFKSVFCVAAAATSAMAAPTVLDRAVCTANKPIDTFASWANNTNSLGSVSGDDKTMGSISVSGTTLSLTTKTTSYFYENLPCEDLAAASSGFTDISFKLSGPAQSSFLLEIQTKANCNATAHSSVFHNVTVPAGTALSQVTVPLSDFTGANLAVATSLTFSTFNKTGDYKLSDLQLVCKK
ncbi:hypothetical protein SPBR_07881 [Sporothrix brasiliensis 5110]|uniref:Ubiquitin 3 binding protein But2 C-terminal domain-containing protein n=1 Tax=Sporothrix brasiliensis 5110 TaxID=1398154 RepID=A0A0C2IJ80_9PEZI|nr:uncharacterized protein SPBR_07881 [Sporothrix brasiliensis 5110]KIH89201.1 hypothetical protein SPBR_07881 [Sporothrix brasiliensis 5110]